MSDTNGPPSRPQGDPTGSPGGLTGPPPGSGLSCAELGAGLYATFDENGKVIIKHFNYR